MVEEKATITDTTIKLKSIHELLDKKFFIPSFQRGYRWTEKEVNDLLDDIWEFAQKDEKAKDEFYCLQPVVVTKRGDQFSLIDGQQRLTTIYIILTYLEDIRNLLGKGKYTIQYETRQDSEQFLQNIDLTKKDDNIDYYHMGQAYETIGKWFQSKGGDGGMKAKLINTLTDQSSISNNVRVIWYEVNEDTDPRDIFVRLNMGKIPLTTAELIKALFLSRRNFPEVDEIVRLRQMEIAKDWDEIELSLQDDEFWYFINNDENEYETRIELILDLISGNTDNEDHKTFIYFHDRLKKPSEIEPIWTDVKTYYQKLREWFDDREQYHLVGYLIAVGDDLASLKKEAENKPKSQFNDHVIDLIKNHVNCQLDKLSYGNDRVMIRKLLLLFNIITLNNNTKANTRFQFGRFKTEKWDIEHIHSVQSAMPDTIKEQKDWLRELEGFVRDETLIQRITDFLSKDNIGAFEVLYADIVKKYSEDGMLIDVNDISNLTLLDTKTNRGYKNAVFPLKRKKIIEKDLKNTFIPQCTKNVFLKYYTPELEQVSLWSKDDRDEYKNAVKKILRPYLPTQSNN